MMGRQILILRESAADWVDAHFGAAFSVVLAFELAILFVVLG